MIEVIVPPPSALFDHREPEVDPVSQIKVSHPQHFK